MTIEQYRITIEGVTPSVDNGRFAVKTVAGDTIPIGADIFKDGHDKLRASVLWRPLSRTQPLSKSYCLEHPVFPVAGWREAPLTEDVNDRWFGSIVCDAIGDWVFTVCAWTDLFASWRDELRKKVEASVEITSELLEGVQLVEATMAGAKFDPSDLKEMREFLASVRSGGETADRVTAALNDRLSELMSRYDLRSDATLYQMQLPVWADRKQARFGSWYEIFVRSQGTDKNRSATFREAEKRLPYISSLGFDILYCTPFHPIGQAFRRGPNNTDVAGPNDPGSCWAIGSQAGGHMAIHPDLGTMGDFDHFLEAAKKHGIEIAVDFAIQCSPDHPWVTEHPAWFKHRPDGSIKYAENPPKKYKDIFPIDFDTKDRDGLFNELLKVVLFWIQHGVKIYRVDNPHTKPSTFWEWLIFSVHRDHPDVLFLAEAFTRPKRMARLAKIGFTQSYTYFTWRNSKEELESYGRELFCTDVRHYLRPNFFANTPDILHAFLQEGGRPAFIIRLVLAATMSPTYGIYNGFELCENVALKPGSEEYLNSEKYEIKVWDWDRPGNIKSVVSRVNAIRNGNPALQIADNFQVLESTCPHLIAYAKTSRKKNNRIVVIVNLDPRNTHEGTVGIPEKLLESGNFSAYTVTDLLNNEEYLWHGYWNYVRLDPQVKPAHILRIEGLAELN
jgi:starch synthase (maltosyl-transferring)